MASKFLDLAGLAHFKDLLVQFVTTAISKLTTTIASTYGTKAEVSKADAKAQDALDAFTQFNTENGIK